MRTHLLRYAIAGLFALVMTVPTSAFASGVIVANEEALAAERDAFVDAWTDAMLSRDAARVEALPHGDAYAHWSPEDRQMAIEQLYMSLEAHTPADAAPIEDEAEASFVKGFLHGFIFERATLQASAEDIQSAIEDAKAPETITSDETALVYDSKILAKAAPHAGMAQAQAAMWASLRAKAKLAPGDLLPIPATPGELDPVFDVVNPLLASAAGMSATGTYTLRVVASGKETVISGIPFCAPIPVDADRDGTTGPGGIDAVATLCLSGTPEASADLSEEGVLRAIATGAGPSLTVDRVGAGDADTPDLGPIERMIIEAYVPLENGLQFARIGFDTTTTGLPAQARVTLVPSIESKTGAPGILLGAVDSDEAQSDARAAADMAADAAGADIPWGDIEALPGEIENEAAPARAVAEQMLADASAQAESVAMTLEQLAAQLEGEATATAQPIVDGASAAAQAAANDAQAAAQSAANTAQQTAQPAVDVANEAAGFYGDRAEAALATVEGTARPPVEQALADLTEASEPARLIVDETVSFYQERAEMTLDEATLALAAAKADAYATVVNVNTEVGLVKNEYVYGDGATGLIPVPLGAAPPAIETPFDDEPGEILGAVSASADSTTPARVPPRFGLTVESSGATGDLVVIGGFATREDTADPFEDESTLVLRFTPAPNVLRLFIEPTDAEGATLRIESPTPTTISALLAMRAGERTAAVGMLLGELPTTTEMTFSRASVSYEATGTMDVLGFFMYDFASYADFIAFLEEGVLTGKYAHAIATEVPTSFGLSYGEDDGRLVYESSGSLGGLDIVQAAFVEDALVGFFTHGRLTDLPESFELLAGDGASTFDASAPIGAVEFERTNGPRLASPPPAFVVGLKDGAMDLIHLRILGIQRLALLDERVTMDLAGGYPLVFTFVNGATEVFGQFQKMPNHIAFALSRAGEAQTVDVTFLPAGFGLWAGMRSPSLGSDLAVVAVDDLAGHVTATIVPSGPALEWHASRITGGVFGGLYGANDWKAAISFGQIPNDMVVSIDQAAEGFPLLNYAASHSTLDLAAYVGPELLTGIGSVYLLLQDMPRLGLGFGVNGKAYNIWSKGPERLTMWYMDISGLNFAVSPISYHTRWVDNWILQAGADLEFAGTIQVKHFYLLVQNMQSVAVTLTAPTLNVSVDGVLSMAIQTVMYTTGYASLYIRALFGWICIICYYVSFNRAGEVPTDFHTWTYSWNVWRWNYISYPVGFCSWWSVLIEDRWVEVGLRLPAGFTTWRNGFSMAYGSTNLFVNPGQLVPGELVYLYALATGFEYYFREYATRHCT